MDEYDIKLFKELYKRKEHYGLNSIKIYDIIAEIIQKNGYINILDFGCGKSLLYKKLMDNLSVKVYRYDPAIEGIDVKPNRKFDFVICVDVLHTVKEEDLYNVLDELKSYSLNAFIYLNCKDHPTLFFDGTKTNRCVHNAEWWNDVLKKFYDCVIIRESKEEGKAMFELRRNEKWQK